MSAHTVITHAPDQYVPSDGMTPCQFRRDSWGRSMCATVGTPTVAVHVLVEDLPVGRPGTHLCAYHSPYDVRTAPVASLTLAKAGDPVRRPALPARVIYRPTVTVNGHPYWDRVWSTPRADIESWVEGLLAEGEYAHAGRLSAYLHAPVPRLPEGAVILPTS